MNVICKLILTDSLTREKWETINHDNDKRNDDFHRKVKPQIMQEIDKRLKKKFGHNCNIKIENGEIVIVSQKFDEKTGRRPNNKITTNIKAERSFVKVVSYLLAIFRNILPEDFDIIIELRGESERRFTIVITDLNKDN